MGRGRDSGRNDFSARKAEAASANYDYLKTILAKDRMKDVFHNLLPKGMNADSWLQLALTSIRSSDDVAACDPMSVLGALTTFASMGLRLEGPLGQAYITARWNRDKGYNEAQAQVGYRGLIDLAFRDPDVVDIEAQVVHRADKFEFLMGTNQYLSHTWDIGATDRGPMVAVYSGVRYRSGYYSFRPYPLFDVLELRRGILAQNGIYTERREDGTEVFLRKDKESGAMRPLDEYAQSRVPWIAHVRPMIMKTAIRWSAKFWRMNPDFERAAGLISIDEAGESQRLAEVARGALPEQIAREVEHGTEQPNTVAAHTNGQMQNASIQRSASLRERLMSEVAQASAGADNTAPSERQPIVTEADADQTKTGPAAAGPGAEDTESRTA